MKNILLIGKKTSKPAEGQRNVLYELSKRIKSKEYNVEVLDIASRELLKKTVRVKNKYKLIHYLSGPSLAGLTLVYVIKKTLSLQMLNRPKIIADILRPSLKSYKIVKFFNIDMFVSHSFSTYMELKKINAKTVFVPLGVDTKKFRPVTASLKKKIREELGIGEQEIVALHVGPLKRGRGLHVLAEIYKKGILPVVIASPNVNMDIDLYLFLKKHGVRILTGYYPNIERFYQMADIYVFPVAPNDNEAIEIPLSVLEAASCNLTIITTKFGGLANIFRNTTGIVFVNNISDFVNINKLIKNIKEIKTREKALIYDWDNIARVYKKIYKNLINNDEV